MLVPASTLAGQVVVSQQLSRPVGHLTTWILDPDNGKIVAYELATKNPQRYLVPLDIIEITDKAVVIREPEQLQSLDNLVRASRLAKQPVRLFKLPVLTEQQQRLGRVEDFVIDTGGHTVAKLYVRPPLWRRLFTHSLIIPRERIVRITPRQVVVRYDTKTASPVTQPEIVQQ